MRKQVCCFVLCMALALGVVASGWAQAPAGAPAGGMKVGIIHIQRAIVESNEGKKAADKLNTQFMPKQNELQAKQAEIERLQKQLREQEKTLSDEARANLIRQVETKSKEFTRSREDAANDLEQAQGQVFNEIGQKVYKVLEDYARKNSYHVILDVSSPQSPVLWASSAVDVTDEIIKLFNAAPPTASGASAAPGAGSVSAPATGAPVTRPGGAVPAAKKPATPTQPRP